ncbi:MFS transporter [Pseudonocardia sp. TRM90224]|uniref:MFS transporter n=1 Tax=Pseudonocardia sp. TRM90224 TaxID=2812678 RepID=UPI001E5C9752|nr:MFS transporter [Pseudonocardia sp. TRM90224]
MALSTPLEPAANRGLTPAGLTTVLLGAALAPLDFFIVNVALPTIGADLRAPAATLEWIVAGYGIAFALLLVVGGRLGDAFGRRRLFVIGLGAFTITSLICGLAPDAATLVVARVAQGVAAGLMVPQVLSIIQTSASGERRSRMLGFYGATAGVAMVIGQVLGGVLVTADLGGVGWRLIFLVNVPIGLLGLVTARWTLPESRSREPLGIDVRGTLLLGLTLLTLLVPLLEGRELGWPWWCWVLLAVCPFAAVAFVRAERQLERGGAVPLLPMSLLQVPSMRRGLAIAAAFFAGFGAFLFAVTLTVQESLGFGPLGSGLALAPLALAFLVTSLLGTGLVTRFGRRVVVVGAVVQAVGLLVLIATTLVAWPDLTVLALVPGSVICGIGQGLVAPTLFRVILSGVPAESAGAGSGALATTQQTALALGVGLLGSLFVALREPGVLGPEATLVLIVGLQVIMVVGIAVAARRLPDPRAGR